MKILLSFNTPFIQTSNYCTLYKYLMFKNGYEHVSLVMLYMCSEVLFKYFTDIIFTWYVVKMKSNIDVIFTNLIGYM